MNSHADIALRAYARWKERGGISGHDLEDWLQAEQDLQSERNIAMKKHAHESEYPEPTRNPEPAPEPAQADPAPSSSEGLPGEKKLKLRAKEVLTVEGVTHPPGDEFELPEREALSLVGTGAAEQISG